MRQIMQIQGMDCVDCERHLADALDYIHGLTVESISHITGELIIEYENEDTLEQAEQAIEDQGYTYTLEEEEIYGD